MPEYIDKEKYCAEVCKCNEEKCDKSKCPIWNAPAADVAPVVHAKWENCDWVEPDYHGFGTIRISNAGVKCTNCDHVFKKDLLWKDNYCPNCGAKMDLEENSNDFGASIKLPQEYQDQVINRFCKKE